MATVSRRNALKAAAFAVVTLGIQALAGRRSGSAANEALASQDQYGNWPALGLRIATPGVGAVREVDLRRDFGAAGDGVQDDAPAFLALAEAVKAGRVAAGSTVLIPPGRYRVVGNQTITFRACTCAIARVCTRVGRNGTPIRARRSARYRACRRAETAR